MHGTIMLFVFLGPFAFAGLGNYLVPLMIGAPDMAFPRFNNLSYWLYLGGFLLMSAGFLTNNGAANFGWFGYAPLTESIHIPGPGADLWIVGVALTGFSGIFTAVNIITTIFTSAGPGHGHVPDADLRLEPAGDHVPHPAGLPGAHRGLRPAVDRPAPRGAFLRSRPRAGQPILWQNLFWFFGHPEVYILALPYFGIVTEVLATMSKKPVFGYKGMIGATLSIGALSMGVWAHHMYTTGAVLLPFFAALSLLIAVPTGIKFFNWIGTMWRGTIRSTPRCFSGCGFLVMFLFGGITGVILAQPVLDFQLHNTYFVVAHFHYVMFGGSAFAGVRRHLLLVPEDDRAAS